MFRYILYAFLIYFAYKFIFGFVIPVYRTTRDVKKKFREMQDNMNQHNNNYQQQQTPPKQQATPKKPAGDYIDFEEI